jgi:ABC-type uncharacterized transport system ATPase subunit
LEKSPFDLSGGQKRRVALAGVIAMRPEVLVLDEPAAGLDPLGRTFIFNGIRAYQRKTGSTVLIVSHSMEDMARYCDEIAVMSEGRLLMMGSRDDVFSDSEKLTEAGLDIPQITRLMLLLRERGIEQPTEADISAAMYTAASPDPDLIVRTGGDVRISNFLLWQAAYSEFYFSDKLWPDLTPEDIDEIVTQFYTRKRRFGGVIAKA